MTDKSQVVIAFYIASLAKGGAERVLINLANAYRQAGAAVYILTDHQLSDEYTDLEAGIERILIPRSSSKVFFLRIKERTGYIRKFLLDHQVQYLVSFMRKCNLRAVAAAKGTGVRTTLSVRSAPEREYPGPIKHSLARHYFKKADGIVFQTEDAKLFFPRKVRDKSAVIMNSVKPAFLLPYYEGERKKEIVATGRLNPIKNHELIVEAFDRIQEDYPDYQVKIYGGGKNEHLSQLIAERGIEDRVLLMGQSEDVIEAIRDASLFILSSNAEGMPNSLIEAMSLGLPCISTDCPCGGPRSLILDGENGLLVPVGDVNAMAEAMQRVLSDVDFAGRLGREATAIQDRIHPDLVNEKWMKYIEEGIQ